MVEDKNTTKGATAPADEFGVDRAEFLPTWPRDDKTGDFVKPFIGTILDKVTVTDVPGIDGGERDVDLYTVVDDDGERWSLWASGMLERVLPPHIGHRVKIDDEGKEDRVGKVGQLRRFTVRCATCTAEGK